MSNKGIGVREIPAAVVLNKFVGNEEDSNYEVFLLEYLNQSKYFQNKSKHERYLAPKSESNGECDAISLSYNIDFKLLASSSYLRGQRLTSMSITKATTGVTFYGAPRTVGGKYIVTWLHKLFRMHTLEELHRIRSNESIIRPGTDEYDILKALQIMETKKNLLLFFPYSHFINSEVEFSIVTKDIGKELMKNFHELSKYREKVGGGYETYILTEYEKQFLLYSFSATGFELLEVFATLELPTYQKLLDYANPFAHIEIID